MSRILIRKIKGFTIIELVAVIVVLGVSLAPIGAMFYQIMAKHAEPEAIQIATALAQRQMEEETGRRFSNLNNNGPANFSNFPNYTYQVIVTPVSLNLANDPGMEEYKQLEVRVVNSSIGITVSLVTVVTAK
jgi:prepilin-type N-terminal cleavage/methylation domain-containing protein